MCMGYVWDFSRSLTSSLLCTISMFLSDGTLCTSVYHCSVQFPVASRIIFPTSTHYTAIRTPNQDTISADAEGTDKAKHHPDKNVYMGDHVGLTRYLPVLSTFQFSLNLVLRILITLCGPLQSNQAFGLAAKKCISPRSLAQTSADNQHPCYTLRTAYACTGIGTPSK